MRTIFIVINEGFSARYILRSKLLEKISTKNKIVILSPNSKEKYFKNEFDKNNIFLEEYNYAQYNKNFFQRTLYNLRLFSFATDNKFTQYWLSDFLKKKNFFFSAIFKLAQILYSKFPKFRNIINFVGNLTSPKRYDFLFNKYKPELIIVTSLGNLSNDCFIMNEAKKNNCKIISFILSWDNTTTKGMYSIEPDYVAVWNKVMYNEINKFHKIDKKKIFIIGTIQYESYLNKQILSKNLIRKRYTLDKKKKTALVCLESPTSFKDNEKILKTLLKYSNSHHNIQFIVRPHPLSFRTKEGRYVYKKEFESFKRYSKISKNLIFDYPKINSMKLSHDMPKFEEKKLGGLLNYVDFVLCFYSSIMLEATIFKKPVINMSFCSRTTIPNKVLSKLKHNERILNYGYVYDVKNICQLYDKINICANYPKRNLSRMNKLLRNEISFIKNSSSLAFQVLQKIN